MAPTTGNWEYDLTTGKLNISAKVATLHGFKPAIGDESRTLTDLQKVIVPEDWERLSRCLQSVDNNFTEPFTIEYKILPIAGDQDEIRYLTVQCSFNSDQNVVHGVCKDVTNDYLKKRLKELREQAAKAKKAEETAENAAKILHDVRNSVTALEAALQALFLKMDVPSEEIRKLISECMNEILYLANLALDNRLANSENAIDDTRIFKANEVLDRVVRGLSPQAQQSKQEIVLKNAEIDIPLRGDGHLVYRVVQNLIANSIKFTPKDGEGKIVVNLNTSKIDDEKSMVEIIVEDNGRGMDKDTLRRLNESFKQQTINNEKYSGQDHGGAGLGLNIVKQFVQFLKGEITVVSEFGKGTKFIVRVPFANAKEAQLLVNKQVTSPVLAVEDLAVSDINVLVVDDNSFVRRATKGMVERMPFTKSCVDAENIAEALKVWKNSIKQSPIRLVLVDYNLNKSTGIELIQAIRQIERDEKLNRTCIIGVTGSGDEYNEAFKKADTDGVFNKPFKKEEMQSFIRNYFSNNNKSINNQQGIVNAVENSVNTTIDSDISTVPSVMSAADTTITNETNSSDVNKLTKSSSQNYFKDNHFATYFKRTPSGSSITSPKGLSLVAAGMGWFTSTNICKSLSPNTQNLRKSLVLR